MGRNEIIYDKVPVSEAEVPMPELNYDGYDLIDRFLRNNLDDDDYAEYMSGLQQYGDAREAAGYAAGVAAVRWRDVADELPKEAQEVLFVRGGKTIHGAWIGGIFWHNNQKMAAAKWMPLPSPQTDAALSGERSESARM